MTEPYHWGSIGPGGYEAGGLTDAVAAMDTRPPRPTGPRPTIDLERGWAEPPSEALESVDALLAWMDAESIPRSAEVVVNICEQVELRWQP